MTHTDIRVENRSRTTGVSDGAGPRECVALRLVLPLSLDARALRSRALSFFLFVPLSLLFSLFRDPSRSRSLARLCLRLFFAHLYRSSYTRMHACTHTRTHTHIYCGRRYDSLLRLSLSPSLSHSLNLSHPPNCRRFCKRFRTVYTFRDRLPATLWKLIVGTCRHSRRVPRR